MCIPLSKWLIAMVRTQSYVGDTMIIYTPVIPHLYQFYPSASYTTAMQRITSLASRKYEEGTSGQGHLEPPGWKVLIHRIHSYLNLNSLIGFVRDWKIHLPKMILLWLYVHCVNLPLPIPCHLSSVQNPLSSPYTYIHWIPIIAQFTISKENRVGQFRSITPYYNQSTRVNRSVLT